MNRSILPGVLIKRTYTLSLYAAIKDGIKLIMPRARIIIYFSAGLFLFGCSNSPKTIDKEQAENNTFQLPDSLFPFKDIQNSLVVNNFFHDKESSILYPDSSKKQSFVILDRLQKRRLLCPILGIDSNYVTQYMDAKFVSKQKMIGDFTPIIVWVNGDDYEALIYILLDKILKPISHFIMNGGACVGSSDGPDATLELCPVINSFLKGNKIYSYSVTEFVIPDSIKQSSIFDSINYISDILPSGQIVTKRIDSTRYNRMSKWGLGTIYNQNNH